MFDIKTDRLYLIPNNRKFLHSIHAYASDLDVTRFMLHLPNDNIGETESFLRLCEENWKNYQADAFQLEFAILYEGKHVGGLGLSKDRGNPCVELGWILAKDYWHKGIAYEAAQAAIAYFAKQFQVTSFIAHCDADNKASFGLMERLGMKRKSKKTGRFNKSSQIETSELLYELDLS
ncbi:N-acetyltransferase [Streptococcus iniae]|uniref:GNAT family N-acetyltransferase n=1 Tax=Streptococcus iniae TaxID=1346 RepID=UPI0002F7DB45|nr:GNAT family N-acetyltransferase [Streptococcus iniae]ESR08932.1 GNAT family acetyltransferase [Streptococcus iniae IUSA1]KYJ76025.1 GNAT family acetyltransferase [Streptococcus iniae]RMI77256.1 N-acetyltransferase [Streptococcus iniae]HEK4518143.1 GNAT family N-acetyltransferase [Streptococcus iniae]